VTDTYTSRVERRPIGSGSLIKIAHSPKFKLGHSLRAATKEDPSCRVPMKNGFGGSRGPCPA